MTKNDAAIEKAKFIVESCTLSSNRAVLIKGLLSDLRYDETASEKECKAVHKEAVAFIQKSFREKNPDVTFDDQNKDYTSIKKQIDLQTKAGRLQGNE